MEEISQNRTIKYLRLLYPFWVLIGIFSIIYVPSTLIDSTDGLATANNISSNILLFRLAIVGRLITQLLFIIIPLLLYRLFEKVDKFMAILMAVLALVSVPITMYNETHKRIITKLLDEPNKIVDALEMYYQGLSIATIFWGIWLFPLGWLVYKSNFFPKIIGVFLYIGGFGYLLGAFTKILFPELSLFLSILKIMTFGELIFIIWLVFVGVKHKTSSG